LQPSSFASLGTFHRHVVGLAHSPGAAVLGQMARQQDTNYWCSMLVITSASLPSDRAAAARSQRDKKASPLSGRMVELPTDRNSVLSQSTRLRAHMRRCRPTHAERGDLGGELLIAYARKVARSHAGNAVPSLSLAAHIRHISFPYARHNLQICQV
jgi:hypothetical protein